MSSSTHDLHTPIAYHRVWVKTPINFTIGTSTMFAFLAAFGPQVFFTMAPVSTQHKALQLLRQAALEA